MASKRTDIHRPSAIVPADYAFVGIEYAKDMPEFNVTVAWERARIRGHMAKTCGVYSTHEHKGNCHVCGAHCIYTAVFYHASTNSYIRTGMDCAEKLEMGDSFRFKRIRDAVEAARESQKGKLKARGILEAAGLGNAWFAYCLRNDYRSACRVLEFSPETPLGIIQDFALENGLEANLILQAVKLDDSPSHDERILIDIVDKLVRYGSLSEKQMAFLTRLTKNLETLPEREAKKAEQREQWKAEKEQADEVPEGKQTVTVTVIKTDWKTNSFGTVLKVLMKAEGGYMLYGNAPTGIEEEQLTRGSNWILTATLERSNNDTKFGFFKRGKLAPK